MRQAREALRKWLIVAALQVVAMTALLAGAPWLTEEVGSWWPDSPGWQTFALWLAWLGAWLLTQLLLVTVVRKVQAGAVLYAEAFRPYGEGTDGRSVRRRTAAGLLAAGLSLLGLWLLAAATLLRPPWQIVALLLLGLIAAGRGAWRAFRVFDAVCTPPEGE